VRGEGFCFFLFERGAGGREGEDQHLMHKVRGNYSSCTFRRSENICNISESAREKRKMDRNRIKLSLAQKVVLYS
jgi:hypothetical protein